MKRIILCLTALLLLFAACKKHCYLKSPKNLKPIDWENYNDIYTVYWNTVHCCSEAKNLQNDTIKISGWKPSNSIDLSSLCDYPDAYYGNGIVVVQIAYYLSEIHAKLDTCDLTKKCYIKGRIYLDSEHFPRGCTVFPIIEITDPNDIYFE